MFENLDQYLQGTATLEVDKTGQPSRRELQISAAVLLVCMAQVDDSLVDREITSMVSNLNRQFGVTDDQAGDVLEVADFLRRDRAKTDEIIAVINENFEEHQKQTILAMLWKVMQADGMISRLEATFAEEVTQRFGFSREHVDRAREMVENGEV